MATKLYMPEVAQIRVLVDWARARHRLAMQRKRDKKASLVGSVRWSIAQEGEFRERQVAAAYLKAAWLIKGGMPMKKRKAYG